MNFYQKVISVITLAVIAITAAIILVCFNRPYSAFFITECTSIFFAEVLTGISFIVISGKSDSALPYSMTTVWICLAYLGYTLMMIFPTYSDIQLKNYILSHFVGFMLFFIVFLIFSLGEHNINGQEKIDAKNLGLKKNIYLQMEKICSCKNDFFLNNKELLAKSRKLADDLRYSATARNDIDKFYQEIEETISSMHDAIKANDSSAYKNGINRLHSLCIRHEKFLQIY